MRKKSKRRTLSNHSKPTLIRDLLETLTLRWGGGSACGVSRSASSVQTGEKARGQCFKQWQKYEKGVNRVGASRLHRSPRHSVST